METEPVEITPVCYWHPDRATGLTCTECGKPICHECSHDAAVGQKCAECARPIGRNRVVHARNMRKMTPVVGVILALTITAFFAQQASAQFEIDFLQFNGAVADGEWWRMITAAFLHGSFIHIGFNMYALYLFGPSLERQVGAGPFAALYLASAMAGGATFFLFGGANAAALGASGAVFGLFGAWIAASYRSRHTPAGAAQFRSLSILLGFNLLLPFMGIARIAWQAHLGGLVAGLAIMAVWQKLKPGPTAMPQRTAVAIGVGLLSLIVALAL